MERIEKVLEDLGCKFVIKKQENGTWYGLVRFWTDTAGQDVPTEIEFDGTAEDFVQKFIDAAKNYDVDEEVEVYADMRGKCGVPETIRELYKDCQEAKDTLLRIAIALRDALATETEEILPSSFDIALLQKPCEDGLTKTESMDLYDMLSDSEALPIDLCSTNGNSSALGFITLQAAEKLNYKLSEYSELGRYIVSVLDDIYKESAKGCYVFNDLKIWLNYGE